MNRIEKATHNFKNGYNCSQSVVAAYADLFGMSIEDALRVSEGFGGGMGRMRLTCGAVTGMFMLAGLKYSNSKNGDLQNRQKIYQIVQDMNNAFEELNGTTICSELLGIDKTSNTVTKPDERTNKYYKKRPCVNCVEDCAKIVEQFLLND